MVLVYAGVTMMNEANISVPSHEAGDSFQSLTALRGAPKGMLYPSERLDLVRIAPHFWKHVDRRDPAECWPWLGAKNDKGYGIVRQRGRKGLVAGRAYKAYRVASALTNGPIPEGMVVMHTCDNRLCCNPAHLVVGTQTENMRDLFDKGRDFVTWAKARIAELERLLAEASA